MTTVDDTNATTGVLLVNLGGPDTLAAVRPFLYNLFSDREIIRLGPAFLQKPIAGLIASLRHRKTEGYYAQIGGGSPILAITNAQAQALEQRLQHAAPRSRVFVGMRYWRPFIGDVVRDMSRRGIRRILCLSLYPHYSVATTGSSIRSFNEAVAGLAIDTHAVLYWYEHPLYIAALVSCIERGLAAFGGEPVHLLFSAHSLPKKFIDEGDPYVEHVGATIAAVMKRVDLPWSLSYQSRSGPVQWLEPSTEQMLEELSERGVKNLLVVPVSFVSDHIETLYEIDIVYKAMAARLGIRLERTASLNTAPEFIAALADIAVGGIREAGWIGS